LGPRGLAAGRSLDHGTAPRDEAKPIRAKLHTLPRSARSRFLYALPGRLRSFPRGPRFSQPIPPLPPWRTRSFSVDGDVPRILSMGSRAGLLYRHSRRLAYLCWSESSLYSSHPMSRIRPTSPKFVLYLTVDSRFDAGCSGAGQPFGRFFRHNHPLRAAHPEAH
jgi:hypothetical protein